LKIVVLDGYALNPGDLSWDKLANLGECVVYDRTSPEEVYSRISDAEIIITNKVLINSTLIGQLPALKYIGVTATGYNVVDVSAANQRKVVVTNIPAYSTDSVAQLVYSHILNVANRVELHANSVKEGKWTNSKDFTFRETLQVELSGKTIGIVGYGQIGRKVGEIGLAFGMKVIFNNRSEKVGLPEGIEQKSLREIFAESDFVSLNCPLTAENNEFVNREILHTMKSNAILINTGRGGLINEHDLAEALNSGLIAAACLDVLSTEPPLADNPLISARNCFITPHIAWATIEARKRLMNITVGNLKSWLSGNNQNTVKI